MSEDVTNVRIAVDFDGTIVEHQYPEIGKEKLFAFETLQEMQKKGFKLILWTVRSGKSLEEAVEFCRNKGVEFYAVNKNYPEEVIDENLERKIEVDIFIDDRNIGGFPGWSAVWQMLNPDENVQIPQRKKLPGDRNRGISWLKRLFGKSTRIFFMLWFMIVGMIGAGCAGNGSSTGAKPGSVKSNRELKQKSRKNITIISPVNNKVYAPGEKIEFSYRLKEAEEIIDSVIYYTRGRKIGISYGDNTGYSWVSEGIRVGQNSFNIHFYFNDGTSESRSLILRFKSDIVPDNYGYRIKNVFPHDPGAYTQGLVYHDGWLYEGTGKLGRSSLRKIKLTTGEIIGTLSLASELFGEGVCIFNDKIIQLTWTSRVGFVYDLATFKFIKKINYPTQGWGLTTDGKQLIMSDGSEKIYFLEPDYFTEQARIEVYDHEGEVRNLNELEYINGEIWANVYQTDRIVRIDPETGKVLAWINLGGLLPQKDYRPETEVLNGIAYDEINKRLFVTGKMWPKLFHIELVQIQR